MPARRLEREILSLRASSRSGGRRSPGWTSPLADEGTDVLYDLHGELAVIGDVSFLVICFFRAQSVPLLEVPKDYHDDGVA